MKKILIVCLLTLLFSACAITDPFTSSLSGVVTSIVKEKVIGAKLDTFQTSYNLNSGLRGFYTNKVIEGFDVSVGDYIEYNILRDENNKKVIAIKVNKGEKTSIIYYIDENEDILETKEVKN